MASKLVRACLVGAGRMGKIRAPLLYGHPKVSFDHLTDPLEEPGRALASKFRAKYSRDIDDIDLSQVDAILISTGTFNHKKIISKAAEAKIPIFCEKPIHESPEVISKLFQLCETHGVPLCCGFQRRFDPSYVAVRDAIAAGSIGNPTMVRVMFADHPAPPMEFLVKGGCPYMDLAPHDLDYLCWALDDQPISVFASGSSSNPELAAHNVHDTAMISLKFKKGAIGTIMMSRGSTYGYDQRMEIFGTNGMVNLGNPSDNSCQVFNSTGVHSAMLKHSFPQRFSHAFSAEIDMFVETVLGNSTWPVSVKDCKLAQVVASAAARSAELGAPVDIEDAY